MRVSVRECESESERERESERHRETYIHIHTHTHTHTPWKAATVTVPEVMASVAVVIRSSLLLSYCSSSFCPPVTYMLRQPECRMLLGVMMYTRCHHCASLPPQSAPQSCSVSHC